MLLYLKALLLILFIPTIITFLTTCGIGFISLMMDFVTRNYPTFFVPNAVVVIIGLQILLILVIAAIKILDSLKIYFNLFTFNRSKLEKAVSVFF